MQPLWRTHPPGPVRSEKEGDPIYRAYCQHWEQISGPTLPSRGLPGGSRAVGFLWGLDGISLSCPQGCASAGACH